MKSRWVQIQQTSPSGRTQWVCSCCGRVSQTPDKRCGQPARIYTGSRGETLVECHQWEAEQMQDPTEKSAPEVAWFYSRSEDDESWLGGPFGTREEAIAEGRSSFADEPDLDHFGVMKAVRVRPEDTVASVIDLEFILERMEDHSYDNHGSQLDSIYGLARDLTAAEVERALEVTLRAWARKYLRCGWYSGESTESVPLADPGSAGNSKLVDE